MSEVTKIQWCDSTVNPMMGCGGCELFPSPGKVLAAIDEAVAADGGTGIDSHKIYKALVDDAYRKIPNPKPGHKKVVNTTNVWHLRVLFLEKVKHDHGLDAEQAADKALRQSITCYAATLHLNKGLNLLKPDYEGHKGYAPIFEEVKQFPGRAKKNAARLPDLLGQADPRTPWKERLPRLIFVSDMGDALTNRAGFKFLESDLMPAIHSPEGKRHLWLWLTKRPERMAEFADKMGGLPENVCAMTTLTGRDQDSLKRLTELKKVKASIRGLSIEPLWDRIPPSELNLTGIDWVIVGGESGSGREFTRPFALEWAEELRDHCTEHDVAFFLKQLGRNPTRAGKTFSLKDKHGGNWDEWPDEAPKIREFPQAFHAYRKEEMIVTDTPRSSKLPKRKQMNGLSDVTQEEKSQFKRLDKIVRKGVEAFMECGKALIAIQERQLWRAGGWRSWEDYCQQVAGISKSYASRIMATTRVAQQLSKELPIGNTIKPIFESQVRPLLKLVEPKQQAKAWASAVEKAEGCQPTAAVIHEIVFEILHPEGLTKKSPSRSDRRADLVERLKAVVAKRKSWELVEELMAELETLL